MSKVQCEITPLASQDLFKLLNHKPANFDYPLHFHSDYELNMVLNTSGKRIVGDTIENFEEMDLVLLGPGLPHAWEALTYEETQVITLQFHEQILNSFLLSKSTFTPIYKLLERSKRGIVFRGSSFESTKQKLLTLTQSSEFDASLIFFSILNDLAADENQRFLCSAAYDSSILIQYSVSRRIEKVCKYIDEHYHQDIPLHDIANLLNMSESAASHFFKKRTGRSFVSYLTNVRIMNSARLLAETTQSIADISFQCGFENLSNFNRNFKKYQNQTPTEYRTAVQKSIVKFI